jgi:hypothetical protein
MRTALFLLVPALAIVTSACDGEGSRGDDGASPVAAATPPPCKAESNTLWSKALGDESDPFSWLYIDGVATDAECNVIVAGSSSNGVDLDASTAGGGGLFVGKLDPEGKLLWRKGLAQSTASGRFTGLAVDASTGEITLVGGTDSPSLDLGGGPLPSDPAHPGQGIFAVRLDAAGNHEWSQRHNATSTGALHGLSPTSFAVGPQGDIVVAGLFQGSLTFAGTGIPQDPQHETIESIIVKLDAAGNVVFVERPGGPSSQAGLLNIAVDGNDDIVVTGSIGGTVNMGVGAVPPTSNGGEMVLKIDHAGVTKWARRLGVNMLDLAVGADSAIYVSGGFIDGSDLGLGPVAAPANVNVPCLTVLDPDGDARSVTVFPAVPGGTYAYRVAVSPVGDAIVVLGANGTNNAFQIARVAPFASTGLILPGTRSFHADRMPAPELPAEPGTLTAARLTLDRSGNILLAGPLAGTTDLGSGALNTNGYGRVNQTLFLAKIAP